MLLLHSAFPIKGIQQFIEDVPKFHKMLQIIKKSQCKLQQNTFPIHILIIKP